MDASLAVIINPNAKNAAGAAEYLGLLEHEGIKFSLYEPKSNELDKIMAHCAQHYQVILVGGGDGTVRTAAQYCANKPTILGVLALGTLNHFSKELDIPVTAAEVVRALKYVQTVKVDLAQVNEFIFVNNSSIGFYPKFANKRDFYKEKYNKWLSYIPSLIDSLKKHETFRVTIKNKERERHVLTSFLMISNNLYSYEFPAHFKRDNLDGAALGLYFFKYGRLRLWKLIRSLWRNKRNFDVSSSLSSIDIYLNKRTHVTIALDGDTQHTTTPLHYQSLPKALTVLVNPS